jgi:hypothetical protein
MSVIRMTSVKIRLVKLMRNSERHGDRKERAEKSRADRS